MKLSKILLLSFALFTFVSCASSGLLGDKENENPLKSADSFYKMLMWKYYDRAAAFVDPEYLLTYEDFVTQNKDSLNITSYEIRELTPEDPQNDEEYKIKVVITYYRYPSVTEESVETWDSWTKSNKRWFVQKDFSKDIFNTD